MVLLVALNAYPLDYPHNEANNIGCSSCHYVYGDESSLLLEGLNYGQNIDDTQFNALCWSCHNDISANYVRTHSSLQIDDDYGEWSVECKVCHYAHNQKQIRTYGSDTYLYSGVSDDIQIDQPVTGWSRLTQYGAGWTVDEHKGRVLVVDVSNVKYGYKILSNTDETLTVSGRINLSKVSVGDTFAIMHGKLIKSTIKLEDISITPPKSGDKEVRFFRPTEMNSFADGDSTYDGICEVCHTQTLFNRNDASGDHVHGIKENCTKCHKHTEGFKGTGCDVCHGYPPVYDGATGGPDGLVNEPGVTGSVFAGAHDVHVNTKGFECTICHYNSAGFGPTHNDGDPEDITIGFSLFDGAYLGGIYDGQTTANYDSSEPNTAVINTGSMACSNIYCHGSLPDGTVWGGGKNTEPVWEGTVTCSSCHDSGGALSDLSYKHAEHTDTSRHGFACEKCHYQTADGSSAIKDESYHVNNVRDIIFSAGGTLDEDTKACASTYCHSNARGGAPNVAVKWTDSAPMQCDSCHNGRTDIDTLEMDSNGHERLVNSNWVRKYPCYYCHDATVNSSGNIKDYSKHVNETKDIVFPGKWNIAGNPLPSYDPETKTCDNIYCHSDGTTVNPEVRPYPWTNGRARCDSCHGHKAGSCSECHDDGRTGWPAGEEWKSATPMYTNTGVGTEKANTHSRHLMTDYNCSSCHANTIINGDCKDCHIDGIPSGNMGEVNHINPEYHVNKIKDISFAGGGTFDLVEKKCSNTACHTSSEPQWGDSVNNLVLCFGCHGTTGSDVDDYGSFNDTMAKINMTEWETTGHGRPSSAGDYASGNPPANFPGNPCWYCHDNSVLHKDESNPFRLRQHQQFEKRFGKECIYCHMELTDAECLGCHNEENSMAPQLSSVITPEDHTGYTDGQTSCVAFCHDEDADIHNTGADLWTAAEKADIKNQYMMMGVCLKCHDDDSNNQCNSCHTGEQYQLGFDPGTGLITTSSKATSTHFGYKHYAAYENNGTWKGGKFCWDCHDPHGDSNMYMIQDKVATETDGTFGIPLNRRDVSFTRNQTGLDYAKTSAPFDGICNVCHEGEGQHYRYDYGDGHNAGRKCTKCHEHRFVDSHSSGKACNTCHGNRPIPRHSALGLPRDCTKCHDGLINKRVDIMGQLRANSHHIQGVDVTNKHCYACHWEATDVGLINTEYHSGYNYKTHETVKDAAADLVIWGPGTRPTIYEEGVTSVTFTASKIGTADERTEVAKVTMMCLGCHSDQNNDTQPFNIVDPENGDCKTPRQYAWDRNSIGAKYSQTGTTTWGKYTGTPNAAAKNIIKAFSAHGNAVENEGGWDDTYGLDGAITNTRDGSENVQCFDCHSSHGSKTSGITSSYITFNGTNNGANLKETQAGKGGYNVTYKAQANTGADTVNPFNAGAAQCFDCHQTETAGTKPWGYSSTFGASAPIMGYRDTPGFGQGTKASTARFEYRATRASILGGHLKASSGLVGLDGEAGTGDEALKSINGLCTPCHDPHGVSPSLGDDRQYAVPLLKGTWLTSPFKEDYPAPDPYGNKVTELSWGRHQGRPSPTQPVVNYNIDRTTFGGTNRISEDDQLFAGLCLRCHPKDNLTDGEDKNRDFRTLDRVHESVKGWGENTEHSYPCSKCHQPHNSGLPRLLQTNCLDYNHRGERESGGQAWSADMQDGSAHGKGEHRGYPVGNVYGNVEATTRCHAAASMNSGSWPDNNRWNNVSQW